MFLPFPKVQQQPKNPYEMRERSLQAGSGLTRCCIAVPSVMSMRRYPRSSAYLKTDSVPLTLRA